MKQSVLVHKTASYAQDEVNKSVEMVFESFAGALLLSKDSKVTIKPNLLMKRAPEQATTTHPSYVLGVIRALQKRGVSHITVADSPGGPYTRSALLGIYGACGMTTACKDVLLNTDTGYRVVENAKGVLIKSFHIINPIANADLVISIGKLKSHAMTTLSAGVKNLFGCVPGLQKPEFHYQFPESIAFCQMLVDLADTVKPALTIIDAVEAMEGDGPSAGTPRFMGVTIASDNPFALDLVAASMIGLKPLEVDTIKHSIARGFCSGDLQEIELLGGGYFVAENFLLPASKSLDFTGHIPKFLHPTARFLKNKVFATKPLIREKDCIGCGKCAESCPAKTIIIKDKIAHIEYKKCIKCYCCHEMCPVRAIDIQTKGLWRKGGKSGKSGKSTGDTGTMPL